MDFEIALRMIAGGTDFRRFSADDDMPAISAFPDLDLALFKHLRGFDILQKRAVALLVVFFDCGDEAETMRELRKALLLGGFCKAFIHIRPFVILAFGGAFEVFGGIADALKLLKPELGMFLFVFCGFQKQRGDLFKALLFCGRREKSILIARFGFAGECCQQVLFRLCACVFVGVSNIDTPVSHS